jgi:hypothetical protein
MTKTKKEAILKDKDNLPQKVLKPEEKVLKEKPEELEVKPKVIEEIKPTGDLKRLAYSGLNFILTRKKDSLLQDDEKQMLAEPLDRLEVEILKILPDWLREQYKKSGPFAGPALEVGVAVLIIMNRRRKPEEPLKPTEPAPDKKEPSPGESSQPGAQQPQ